MLYAKQRKSNSVDGIGDINKKGARKMFIKSYNTWKLEDTKTVELKCSHCSNTTSHFVCVAPHGVQFGIVFMKKPIVGMKKYFLQCPICDNLSKEITREQAYALKDDNI